MKTIENRVMATVVWIPNKIDDYPLKMGEKYEVLEIQPCGNCSSQRAGTRKCVGKIKLNTEDKRTRFECYGYGDSHFVFGIEEMK